jgi:hypothetical protein
MRNKPPTIWYRRGAVEPGSVWYRRGAVEPGSVWYRRGAVEPGAVGHWRGAVEPGAVGRGCYPSIEKTLHQIRIVCYFLCPSGCCSFIHDRSVLVIDSSKVLFLVTFDVTTRDPWH